MALSEFFRSKYTGAGLEAALDSIANKIDKNGDQVITGSLTIASGDSGTGNLIVQGDLTVQGTTTTTETESLVVHDNLIVTNSEGAALTNPSGLAIKIDATNAYGIVYDPTVDQKGIKLLAGTINEQNELVPSAGEDSLIATRANSTTFTEDHIAVWNAEKYRFEDGGKTIAEIEGEITTQVGAVQTALDTAEEAIDAAEAAIDVLEAKTVQVSGSATETLGATTKALATKEYVDTQMASAGTLTSVELKKGTEAQANSLILAVNGSDQNVVALGSAAFTESSAYATAAQGAKADTAYQKPADGIPETDLASAVQDKLTSAASALQASDITLASGTNNGTLKLTVKGSETDNIAVKGLGSAAYTDASAYATAAQGTKADTALQPDDVVITEGDTNGAISVKVGDAAASSVSVHGLGDAAYTTVAAIVAEAVEAVPEVPAATTAVAGIAKLGAAGGAATFEAVQSLTTTVGAKADQSVVDSLTARVAAIEALLSSDEYDIFFVKKQA